MSKQVRLNEIKEDLVEYNKLFEMAQRPKVKQILSKQIAALNVQEAKILKQIELQQKKAEEPKQQKEQTQKTQLAPKINPNIIYTALTKYSWQDESKKAKIYFSLQNIGNQCTANQIDIQFKPNSVELRIRNYRKQNLIFSIKKTFGPIIPQQCKYLVKTNLLSITLTKVNSETWTQLHFKEDKFSAKNQKQDLSDPNASIMNMMKKMYQEGDETMKKTMAEAWTKSRDNKGSDSFKFD